MTHRGTHNIYSELIQEAAWALSNQASAPRQNTYRRSTCSSLTAAIASGLSLPATRSHFRKLRELREEKEKLHQRSHENLLFHVSRGTPGCAWLNRATTHGDVSLPRGRVEFSAKRGGNRWVRNCRAVLNKSSCHHE